MPHAKWKSLKIFVKRAYEDATPEDGYRVLVDRLRPPGRSKEILGLGHWARDVAPSAALRKRFGHKRTRWDAFRRRYCPELDAEETQPGVWFLLADAKDEEHGQAIVLRDDGPIRDQERQGRSRRRS